MIDRSLLDLDVLYETPHELVVVKPAGMASELTSDPRGVSLISRTRRACPPPLDPKLPHRLDRVARGVVLIALTGESIAFHNAQIRAGAWSKYYLARVHVPHDRPIEALLGQHKAYLKRVRQRARIVRSGGKPSFLIVLSAHPAPGRPNQAHLLIQLLTGRFHQIRAMLQGLGAPLAGDAFYGAAGQRPRDWDDFYLEHVALKYVDYAHRAPRTAHLRDDPGREPISPALRAEIEALVAPPPRGGACPELVEGD
jgi:23S rRNA-/tRNA-specific pseudouridylate synthase